MSSFREFPSPRDPFETGPRFDLFGAFAFLSVLVLFGAMYLGLYAGPFVQTSRFELPDIFGTKAQETAQKLLVNVAIPNQPASAQAAPTATAGPKTIVPVVNGESAEAGITIPFGIGANQGNAVAAAPPPAVPTAAPTPVAQTSEHAVGSRHRVFATGGDGVFVRRAPASNDKIRAWADNTVMEFQGELVDVPGNGSWAKMKDPAGNVGWVPAQYLTPDKTPPPAPAPPPAAPVPPAGIQTVPVAQPASAGVLAPRR